MKNCKFGFGKEGSSEMKFEYKEILATSQWNKKHEHSAISVRNLPQSFVSNKGDLI